MPTALGVVMDPIATISPKKDSTLAMLLEAQRRGYRLLYAEQRDLFLRDGEPAAQLRPLRVFDDPRRWFDLGERAPTPLRELQVLLMRKDPPVDMDYLFTTHVLELAERRGLLVVNRPASLRDANEKLFTLRFEACGPPTLVSADLMDLRAFLAEQHAIILKPLEAMGGRSVFLLRRGDPNASAILETMTNHGARLTMAQRFLPEIAQGDRRILLIDGEPLPYALARIPAPGELRGNLAAGARAEGVELSDRDRWLCSRVGPTLREMGLLFVGLDVIGPCITEINVTSPTGIREIDALFGVNAAAAILDAVEEQLGTRAAPRAAAGTR